jgi:exodeoxyribonuclease V gamma subunit
VVLYTGADERTGAERPPAVPLGELLDVLERTAVAPDGTGSGPGAASVRDHVLRRHPLQPFDARNFVDVEQPGRLRRGGPFSFDVASYDGSLALRGGQAEPQPFLAGPLSTVGSAEPGGEAGGETGEPGREPVSLDTLARFLEHPVRGFLRERLDVRTADEQDEPSDAVPVAPNNLELWQVGDRALRAGLAGHSRADAEHVERLRGELPPGRLGAAVLDPVVDDVESLLVKTLNLRNVRAETYDVSLDLPSGARIEGSVPRVHGDCLLRIEYSKLSPKHRIRAWVQLLALIAGHPDGGWRSATVGRGASDKEPVVGAFVASGQVSPQAALAALDRLVGVYHLGLTRPLPVPPKTACAYAEKRRDGVNPETAAGFAGKKWRSQGSNGAWGEFDDGDHRRCGLRAMEDLRAELPVEGLEYDDEPHLFGQLARAIWTPLLEVEDRSS